MKNVYKLLLLSMLVVTVSTVFTASASAIYLGRDAYISGSQKPKTSIMKLKASPIEVRVTLPDVYKVGVPTFVKAQFIYRANKRVNFGTKRRPVYKKFKKVYGKKKLKVFDIKHGYTQTTGDEELDRSLSDPVTGDSPVLGPFEESTRFFELRPNHRKTILLQVTFSQCYNWPVPVPDSPQALYLKYYTGQVGQPGPNYPCVFAPGLGLKWQAKIRRGAYSSRAEGVFNLHNIPIIP